jgi:predicted glycoside hydrolase/deacetylase ChbG (UPF0249 family)/glycosyltransferase involved in cell wall biosynthesis
MPDPASEKRVIVNADDFGFAPGVTEGILQAHRQGIVTSTTIAANMPAAEEAVRRLAEAPALGVGVHLNASQGPPLSRAGAALAGEDGVMNRTAAGVIFTCILRPGLMEAMAAEFDAQVRWVLDHGIRPTHLDSHRHAHAFPPLFARVAKLARRYHIPFVRRHGESLRGRGWPACPAKQRRISRLLNAFGRINAAIDGGLFATGGTWGIAHTGCLDAGWFAPRRRCGRASPRSWCIPACRRAWTPPRRGSWRAGRSNWRPCATRRFRKPSSATEYNGFTMDSSNKPDNSASTIPWNARVSPEPPPPGAAGAASGPGRVGRPMPPSNVPSAVKYSIIVPFYNEEDIAEKLYGRIARVMRHEGKPFEMIFINDGSKDGTGAILEKIALQDERVTFIDLRRNFGQTTALQAGLDHAQGEVFIAMDGDLQHDPYEIPLFIRKIDEGYDIASGWRVRRGDNLIMRRIPSRAANWLLAKVSGVKLHDFGTTFKAYRREALEGVRLYGDMHRFVPAICARLGAKICEVPIKNVRRASGKSNYGIGRTFRVALDILTVRFISKYMTRPLHLFGKWGLICGVFGGGILVWGAIQKIHHAIEGNPFHLLRDHGPLLALGFMLIVMAMFFLATGIMGELMMRIYFEASPARTYAIRRVIHKD